MASGFIILADGRCFAPRWLFYDGVLRAVADELSSSHRAKLLRDWLLSLLPGPDDEEHLGYGPWLRAADHMVVARSLDVRELAPENQRLFNRAVQDASRRAMSSEARVSQDWLVECLAILADMVDRAERGEPPLSRSDWREVHPSEGRRIGPGWTEAE